MPTVETKFCSKCVWERDVADFHRDRSKPDGLYPSCKDCEREKKARPSVREAARRYSQSEKGKAKEARYKRSAKGIAVRRKAISKYSKTEKGKAAAKRSRQTAEYKAWIADYTRAQKARYPERFRARLAVKWAVRSNQLPPLTLLECSRCRGPASHYHHHAGYASEHKLDVVPLCRPCHERIHHGSEEASTVVD